MENLELHGLHPRFLHVLANAPYILGPIYLMAIYQLLCGYKKLKGSRNGIDLGNYTFSFIQLVFWAVVVSGLTLLSIVPHQEPRFLLPLIGPLVIAMEPFYAKISQLFWV